jgi:hypothetical protein
MKSSTAADDVEQLPLVILRPRVPEWTHVRRLVQEFPSAGLAIVCGAGSAAEFALRRNGGIRLLPHVSVAALMIASVAQ